MFCSNCGKELKPNAVFCTFCGQQVAEPVPVAAATASQTTAEPYASSAVQPEAVVEPQIPAQEPESQQYIPQEPAQEPENYYQEPVVDTFELNTEPDQKKRGFSLSKGKIAAIVIGAVLLIAAVVVIFNFGAIQNFFLRNGSPDEIMKTVEKEELGQVVNTVSDVYGNMLDAVNGKATSVEANLSIVLSDECMDMIKNIFIFQGADVDLSFLQKIDLVCTTNINDSLQQVTLGFGLGDVRIATLDIIMNTETMTVWMGIPEFSSEYIELDGSDLGLSSGQMNQAMGILESIGSCLPSEEVVNSLLNKYIGIALDQISSVERSEGSLELQGLSMDCLCLKTTVDEKTVLNMAIAVLKEARNDQQIRAIINDVVSYAADMSGVPASQMPDVYAQYQEAVDDALEGLNEELEYCGDEAFYYYDYLDNNNNVIGRRLSFGENDIDVYYYTVYAGNEHAFIADLGEVKITGSGTKKGNLTSGTYLVSVDGAEMIQIDIMDLDEARLEKGEISGTIGLSFTREFAEMMAYEIGDSYTASLITSIQLQLEMNTTSNFSVMNLKVLFNGTELFGIYTDSKLTNGGFISVPTNTISASNDEDMMYWFMSMDWDSLISKLEEAGVPYDTLKFLLYDMP